ncbi:MAG: response regulator [Anaerolineales bacterium]|nr:response regulator [Anaerolineales bacterium]
MKHVLIVDDDRTTVRLLTMLLEFDGYKVSQKPRPDSALEFATQEHVDAFIIDCNLAGYNGIDLLKAIRADETLADRPAIMTSGKDLERESLAAGADVFLLKPFSTTVLTDMLAKLLK